MKQVLDILIIEFSDNHEACLKKIQPLTVLVTPLAIPSIEDAYSIFYAYSMHILCTFYAYCMHILCIFYAYSMHLQLLGLQVESSGLSAVESF